MNWLKRMVKDLMKDCFKLAEKESVLAVAAEIIVPGLDEAIALLRQSFPSLSEDSIATILGLPSENRTAKPTVAPATAQVPE
jgi:hypothetical protein